MAVIGLEKVRFYAYHGYYEEENIIGGEFELDVFVDVPVTGAAAGDDLGRTVNYETIFFICESEMKKTSKLIETVAMRILERLQTQFEGKVMGVKVILRKIAPPMDGKVGCASIEVQTGSFSRGSGGGGGMFNFFDS
jgi:dihydroneopterin aldolase